jgi:hypothetical protein
MGHDQGPDNHEGTEAQHQCDLVGGVGLEGPVGDREEEPQDQAGDEDAQHRPGHPGPALPHGAASPPPECCDRSTAGQRSTPPSSRDRYEARTHDDIGNHAAASPSGDLPTRLVSPWTGLAHRPS